MPAGRLRRLASSSGCPAITWRRFVVEVIERLDLEELTSQYAGRGSAAHHPAVLLGLLVYG